MCHGGPKLEANQISKRSYSPDTQRSVANHVTERGLIPSTGPYIILCNPLELIDIEFKSNN